MQMERTPNARPSWGELLEEAESRGGDIAGAAPPRLGFQSATHAEVLSIEELIEALDKVGMYTHTSKTAVGCAKEKGHVDWRKQPETRGHLVRHRAQRYRAPPHFTSGATGSRDSAGEA